MDVGPRIRRLRKNRAKNQNNFRFGSLCAFCPAVYVGKPLIHPAKGKRVCKQGLTQWPREPSGSPIYNPSSKQNAARALTSDLQCGAAFVRAASTKNQSGDVFARPSNASAHSYSKLIKLRCSLTLGNGCFLARRKQRRCFSFASIKPGSGRQPFRASASSQTAALANKHMHTHTHSAAAHTRKKTHQAVNTSTQRLTSKPANKSVHAQRGVLTQKHTHAHAHP